MSEYQQKSPDSAEIAPLFDYYDWRIALVWYEALSQEEIAELPTEMEKLQVIADSLFIPVDVLISRIQNGLPQKA